MELNNGKPIYMQLAESFKRQIASGALKPGDKVAAVRDLAATWTVNPNTMQKALAYLETEGLVFTERTSGRYVTRDESVVAEMRKQMLRAEVKRFAEDVRSMGYTVENAIWMLEEYLKD
ncbi:GntR family transcriptional regulator [Clostridia bacterium]|nr:GntR family transcriptional regulator [Clostridia bacterium]